MVNLGVLAEPVEVRHLTRLRADHLLRTSLFTVLTTVVMGISGLLFWAINARHYSVSQVGVGSTLVTASSLIAYCSLLGFNQTFVRSLPKSHERNDLINTGMTLVFATGILLSATYIVLMPAAVPDLRYVKEMLPFACGFVGLSACAALNLATDAIFLSYRGARYNLFVDGLLQSGVKLCLPVLLVGLGSFGIYAATGIASGVAALASVLLLKTRFAYRPRLYISRAVLRREFSFSAAAYVAHLLDMSPMLLLPIILIRTRGAADAAYFFIAFQIAGLVYAVAYAVNQSMFVEGAHAATPLVALARRAARVQALVIPAGSLVLAGMSPAVLSVVGPDYGKHGTHTLIVLCLASTTVALSAWSASLLKLVGELRVLVFTSVVHAGAVCGLAGLWAHRGPVWVACAWLIGNLLSGILGAVALFRQVKRVSLVEGSESR